MGTSEEDGVHRWAEMAMERTLTALLLPPCLHFFSSLKFTSSSLNSGNSPLSPCLLSVVSHLLALARPHGGYPGPVSMRGCRWTVFKEPRPIP